MSFSFVTAAYNEFQNVADGSWIRECIEPAIRSPHVDEVIVCDDGSADFPKLQAMLHGLPKVRLSGLPKNVGTFSNKCHAISLANNDWVVFIDSDNRADEDYFDRMAAMELDPRHLYCPTYAQPNFDYRGMGDQVLSAGDVVTKLEENQNLFGCFINTGNQTLHAPSFLRAVRPYMRADGRHDLVQPDYFGFPWREDLRHRKLFDCVDTLFTNKLWLMASREHRLRSVSELTYFHRWRKYGSAYGLGSNDKHVLPAIYFWELKDWANHEKHDWRVILQGERTFVLERSVPGSPAGSPCDHLTITRDTFKLLETKAARKK